MEVVHTDIQDADARQEARGLIASVAYTLGTASGDTLYDIWVVFATLGICVSLLVAVWLLVYMLRANPADNRPRSSVTLAYLRTKSGNDESSDNGD
jgi:hypothetical protein